MPRVLAVIAIVLAIAVGSAVAYILNRDAANPDPHDPIPDNSPSVVTR